MQDPRIQKLAQVLVNYSVAVRPDDWVMVRGDYGAMPLTLAVVEAVVKAGGKPTLVINHEEAAESMLKHGSDALLDWVDPSLRLLYNEADAFIALRAAQNTRTLTGIDPARQQRAGLARRELSETTMRRAAEGSLRWTLTNFPCEAYAQEADMSLRDYEDFVYGATGVLRDDPVAYWLGVREEQARLVEWLDGKKAVTVKSPNIDMTLSIEGRTFINADGSRNMPDGEIFTGPVEDSVNGWVKFTYPAIRGGREVTGVELEFKAGKVVSAKADKNEDYLISQLDSDEGARYLGEFAIGTNYNIQQFTKSILFDEKIGGTLHMAVGAGYPDTGSVNRSNVHWDFICDMRTDSEITVDGELFYKDGQFQI